MVIARRKRRVCGGVHRGASSLRRASRTLRSSLAGEGSEVAARSSLPIGSDFIQACSMARGIGAGNFGVPLAAIASPRRSEGPGESPPNRGGEAPAGAGAERRTPWPALRSGRSLHREGPPVHDADRRAFRRFTAASLGFGTVLPGPDGEHFARPDPGGFGLRSSGPRPARQGAVPRSWDGRWTRSLPGICLRGTSAGAAPRSAFRTPPEGALGEWEWDGI
jgi:hypothetical protein